MIVVTDGRGSHRCSAKWPQRRLVAERYRETRRALRRLCVLPPAIEHLGYPDAELGDLGLPWQRGLARAIARRGRPDLLIGPSLHDDHDDHRAIARAVAAGEGRRVPTLHYRVWPARHRCARRGRAVVANFAWKRSLIIGYRTQLGVIRDDPDGFSIAPHELRAFACPLERFEIIRR